jgi:hypothetical protein
VIVFSAIGQFSENTEFRSQNSERDAGCGRWDAGFGIWDGGWVISNIKYRMMKSNVFEI